MSKPFVFEKPAGMRDTLPAFYQKNEEIKNTIKKEMESWGYQFIQTPTLEYHDTVGEASAILDQQLFKLLDMEGKTLVLRPDMTAPIARVVSSSMKNVAYPLRLAYNSPVFRAQQREGGRPAEFEQVGIELIGEGTASAEAEALALMTEVIKKSGIHSFTVAVGHIGFVQELLRDILGNEARAGELLRYLNEKNYVGYTSHVKQLPLSSIDTQRLLKLLDLRGGIEVLDEASSLNPKEKGKQTLKELKSLYKLLQEYDAAKNIVFDFTLFSHMSYYTGIVFEGYAAGIGAPIASGGRYDELLSRFERKAPAIGFAIRMDYFVEALGNKNNQMKRQCILYTGERRKEALQLARSKREEGGHVVMQDLSGVENVDEFSKRFDEIHYLIGSQQGEDIL
ncbi:ATP phosphoribosyltransferase regulatory subunit [Fictibacillus barbaricus]|uniref:ATP phosphoribosyltransferase regulatory subunit n=1 Tax=Fictibacillus barbaricus TaxID=182136 RepID=A0ABS2ZHR6_9BACL|nr:ATP phosphoribosyltransferase regulatory subunit [Fictibacillus barbaricus]MBN3546947.1 ATP phosphoribosyltransferase regulatory subunit [Fictibacillus barbaricus]GGB45078.1 ATP phosphoribosyltransferase regulatory subunit [Fictibacillus barbaricus]